MYSRRKVGMTRTLRSIRAPRSLPVLWICLGLAACDSYDGNPAPGPSPVLVELASISLASSTVVAGGTVQGTASLSAPAAVGGATVSLSSSHAGVATVPASITVPQGAQSATFVVTGVADGGPITITGSLGTSRTASLTVTAAPIQLLSVRGTPTSVSAPGTSLGTVTISRPAPAEGISIALSSANTFAATVPPSVTIPQGSTTATFPIEAIGTMTTVVPIRATLDGTLHSFDLVVVGLRPGIANFIVVAQSGTMATGDRCEVQAIDGGSANLMKCTFDASLSMASGGISSHIWRFPEAAGVATHTTTFRTLSGITLTCGSFGTGEIGTTVDRDVELEIVFPSGTMKIVKTVTFIRNGPC
jgi:hypothetical protein